MNLRTEIYVNGTSVDLFEDIPLNLNYLIQDIRTPDKRTSAFSKTIKLPGSPTNNKLFTHLFELDYSVQTSGVTNFAPDFNPNLKANVVVYIDSAEQFKGILKLDRIIKVNNDKLDYKIEYECTIYGKLANIFVSMGDKKLTDIDLSTYNHTYNKANIKASWTATVGTGYVYPMIDYGYTNCTTFNTIHWFPAIYLREYLAQIFQQAGFQWTSDFLDSTFFRRLIIPFNGQNLKLTDTQVLNRMFRASCTSDQTYTIATNTCSLNNNSTTILFNDDSTTPNFDTTNQYSTGTGKFTAANSGYYTFNTFNRISLVLDPVAPDTSNQVITVRVYFIKNGTQSIGNSNLLYFDLRTLGTITATQVTASQDVYLTTSQVYLAAGDTVEVKYYYENFTTGSYLYNCYNTQNGTIKIRATTTSYFNDTVINSGIFDGDTLALNNAIPADILQRDLFKWIINCFNLYIEEDKFTPNKLKIEPYVDYYTSGVTVDWTTKLDISQPITIDPMGALEAKRYRYKYKEDSDYFNDKYKKQYGETYGTAYTDITNDFIKDEQVTEVGFSPTPLVQIPNIDRIIPSIKQVDQNGNSSPKTSNIRLLYWGGSLSTNNSWTFTSAQGTTTETTYPYAGEVDHPTTPTLSLDFGIPREVYYDIAQTSQYTDNTLYNKYYSQWIAEISDRNSKILTAYFYLEPKDIESLDFRNKIFLEGNYYRLNKIYDYDPVNVKTTKCELLKIKQGVPFASTIRRYYGGGGSITAGGGILTSPIYQGGNIPQGSFGSGGVGNGLGTGGTANGRTSSSGIGSYVSPLSTMVTESGVGNVVGDNCSRIAILNSSGCTVSGGVSDVVIMNSSGLTVNDSGQTWISNLRQGENKPTIVSASFTTTEADNGKAFFVDTSGGNVTISMHNSVTEGFWIDVKKISISAVGSVIITSAAHTFDGAASITFSTQYTSYRIKHTGNSFYII
jgi:hypothetical protein